MNHMSNHKGRNEEMTMNESKQWKYRPWLGSGTKMWQGLTLMRSEYSLLGIKNPLITQK
jgi:hypothetical protein